MDMPVTFVVILHYHKADDLDITESVKSMYHELTSEKLITRNRVNLHLFKMLLIC